jgi:hypothetical protein
MGRKVINEQSHTTPYYLSERPFYSISERFMSSLSLKKIRQIVKAHQKIIET